MKKSFRSIMTAFMLIFLLHTVCLAEAPAAQSWKSDFYVVYPDSASAGEAYLAQALADVLSIHLDNAAIPLQTDRYSKKDGLPNRREILIGATNREESAYLNQQFANSNANYGIYTSENRVAVSGSDLPSLSAAINLLMETLEENEYCLKNGMLSTGTFDYALPDFSHCNDKQLVFAAESKLARIPKEDGFSVMQGGGTDGKFAYYIMLNASRGTAMIRKYDQSTWELMQLSPVMQLEHGNDVAYDASANRLIISACDAQDDYRRVHYVAAGTLEYLGSEVTPIVHRAIDSLPDGSGFVFGGDRSFTITDPAYAALYSFDCASQDNVAQGLCCDDQYIYDLRYIPSSKVQAIAVYSRNGDFYSEFPLIGLRGEPENIFRVGDHFIIGCNASSYIYQVSLLMINK